MKTLNKKLLLVVAPKDATFGSKEQFEQNAVLFNEYMLKKFSNDIIPLLNSISSKEWILIDDDFILNDCVNKNKFNYWFKVLED